MFRKELARRTGGKRRGRSCGGRACREVMSVAASVGGTGDSVGTASVRRGLMGRVSNRGRTSPGAEVGEAGLFDLFSFAC